MKVGFVVPEILDGRFVPWEASLDWESYLDFYCAALERRGHECIKYVPSIGVTDSRAYVHKFGHVVKRVPVYNRVVAPRALLRPRKYASGYTTTLHPLLALPFAVSLSREVKKDRVEVMHHASYYSSFFVATFITAAVAPQVVQYTGGAVPQSSIGRSVWKLVISPSLRASRGVLIGDYPSERATLDRLFKVPKEKLFSFDAPIVDREVFHEIDRVKAQTALGFDPFLVNILAVTFIPRKHSLSLAKDPFLMVDVIARMPKLSESAAVYIAGWGPGTDELQEYIREKGLSHIIHMLGMVEHSALPTYYSASDLVFVPIQLDRLNQGSATLEAFSCSRPVVAFKLHPDDATEQVGGFLLENEPEAGGRTLADCIAGRRRLRAKGKEGLAFSDSFTVENAGKTLETIYTTVLGS